MATPSTVIKNFSPQLAGPRTMGAVKWNTWNKTLIKQRTILTPAKTRHIWLDTIHTLYRWCPARKSTCEEQNDRTFPMLGRLLVEDNSSCRCSCTKDWYSALKAFNPLPARLTQTFSRSPSNSLIASWTAGEEVGYRHM